MSKDELRAWLLLAGFHPRWRKRINKYIRIRNGNYITVEFFDFTGITVNQFEKHRHFFRPNRAQQYIQSLIGE